mgnify:CR=1 FL=1
MILDKKNDDKDRLLLAMLPHVVFDGWSPGSLAAGMRDLDAEVSQATILFPGGMRDLAVHFGDYIDRKMLSELGNIDMEKLSIRERIGTSVLLRLRLLSPHKEEIRRLLSFLALPGNHPTGFKITMKTIDLIWYAAGDTATDFNYYTKRGLLASIYVSTIIYWLSDTSHNQSETNAFLSQRIDNVMQIPKLKGKVVKKIKALVSPLGFIKSKIS